MNEDLKKKTTPELLAEYGRLTASVFVRAGRADKVLREHLIGWISEMRDEAVRGVELLAAGYDEDQINKILHTFTDPDWGC